MPKERVGVVPATDDEAPPSICATLAGIELGEAHIHRAASHGFFPATQIEVVVNMLITASNSLKGVLSHMPDHDANRAKIVDLIERIAG